MEYIVSLFICIVIFYIDSMTFSFLLTKTPVFSLRYGDRILLFLLGF